MCILNSWRQESLYLAFSFQTVVQLGHEMADQEIWKRLKSNSCHAQAREIQLELILFNDKTTQILREWGIHWEAGTAVVYYAWCNLRSLGGCLTAQFPATQDSLHSLALDRWQSEWHFLVFWVFFFFLQLLLTLLSVLCQREDLFFTVVWLVGWYTSIPSMWDPGERASTHY